MGRDDLGSSEGLSGKGGGAARVRGKGDGEEGDVVQGQTDLKMTAMGGRLTQDSAADKQKSISSHGITTNAIPVLFTHGA